MDIRGAVSGEKMIQVKLTEGTTILPMDKNIIFTEVTLNWAKIIMSVWRNYWNKVFQNPEF